ncbi:hypothetical protein JTE90_028121 [Oedothorax gibbosus]|uniref:RRP12-like protein n=1 Tax=Oedothorax gibbosus TaxID=931172 RepID=A0AAV6VBH1_9ARAC|nr:hypothetical protein JTE90_028121 [Oedothorax gibbosus]
MGSKNKANKKATKGRGIMWKKGQSSSHNPKFNKHRQEAKKRPLLGNQGSGTLTAALLEKHNKNTAESVIDENEELMSIGGDTAVTAFTNCSLGAFNRLMKTWNAGSFLHKQMVAVLVAVTELLQGEGKSETETDYFAALMTMLDVVDTDEDVTAVVCLLSMLVKRLKESVVKFEYKRATEAITKLLVKYMNSDHCALLRNLLTVLYSFMKVKTHWSATSSELNVMLEFTTHHKPKVRKVAHQIVHSILTYYIPESATVHPCATSVANFCVEKLETSAGKSSSRELFYILSLLQENIASFPKPSIKKCCETVFKIMTLSTSVVTLCGLKSLQGLFSTQNKTSNFPADLNAKIISALYDYQPNVKDSECLVSWLVLMEKALINLYSLDEKLCISHLPKFFAAAVKCWVNESDNVIEAIATTLKNILQKCIDPTSEVFQQVLFEDPVNNAVHKMFHSVEEGLSYPYHKAWGSVLFVLAAFFEATGKHCYTAMIKCLRSLGDLHDSYNFPHIPQLEKTIGVAIQHMGPCVVLQAIPFKADSDRPDFTGSWLLPLLRDYVKKTELIFFVKEFRPLALKMREKALILKQEGKIVESKLFEVACSQIWSLLPGFCTEPTDLLQSFKEVAKTLGMTLQNEPSLRLTILNSLRLLITKNLENAENREELAKYAKNYLPIFFNLYTTQTKDKEEENTRLAVYSTLKVYLQITDKELCSKKFADVMKALEALPEGSETFMQPALIDLCKALVSHVPENQVEELYVMCKPLLKHTNHTLQKKAFSVIKEICSSDAEFCVSFVKSHLDDLRLLLGGNHSGLTPATRALRLNCLQCIVSQLTESEKPTVLEIIPEAVLCTKENSLKARAAAYNLLVEIGNTLQKFSPDNHKEAVKEYITILLAGLGGSPHLMSATILAIGRIMYEFKDELEPDVVHILIENMCLLISSRSREVVVSALSFMKILFAAVGTDGLAQHVEFIVKSLTSISEDNQRPFRFKAKEIFVRLVRKFGYEMIAKMVPEKHMKQLNNIRKTEARKKRHRDSKGDEMDSEMYASSLKVNKPRSILEDTDDEMLEEDDDQQKTSVPRKKKAIKDPCLEEAGEDDIVDFLDPAVNKRLLTRNSEKNIQPMKQAGDAFPISADGKLIIEDEDDEKESKSKLKKETQEKGEVLRELGAFKAKKNKRKYEYSDDEGDDVDEDPKGVNSGIHRDQGPKRKKLLPGEQFKAKKAGGDVKKGKLEPFAYMPLNPQALNKRKQLKLKGQFKTIVRAAKKGASKGVKGKSQNSRNSKKKKRQMF